VMTCSALNQKRCQAEEQQQNQPVRTVSSIVAAVFSVGTAKASVPSLREYTIPSPRALPKKHCSLETSSNGQTSARWLHAPPTAPS
jgi:hypothetical protein